MHTPIRESIRKLLGADTPKVTRELGDALLTMAASSAKLKRLADVAGEPYVRALDHDLTRAIRLARTLAERAGARHTWAEYTSMRYFLQALVAELRVLLPDTHRIEAALGDRTALVATRLPVVASLLAEACGAALDAMPSGGTLGFELEELPERRVVIVRILDTGDGSNARGEARERLEHLVALSFRAGTQFASDERESGGVVTCIQLDSAC